MVLDFFAGHLLFCCFVKEIMKKTIEIVSILEYIKCAVTSIYREK